MDNYRDFFEIKIIIDKNKRPRKPLKKLKI